jgi:RNA polymerase sigma-70 factor (ECF subfamily)
MPQDPPDIFRGASPSVTASEPSLDHLVNDARSGDCMAFAALFKRFSGPITTYLARMIGDDEMARDLAQETFLRAWKSLPALRGDLYFKAWLYRIATNLANSHLRSNRLAHWLPWQEDQNESSRHQLSVSGPEENFDEAEIIKQTWIQLSPQYRSCLLLQIVVGCSRREVAEILNISEQSVGSNVFRGREQFRQIYHRLKGNAQ